MVVFPNCKINIGLKIIGKRPDGFHNLETVFFPIPLHDSLEIIRANKHSTEVVFSQTGNLVEGNANDNLCVKAYHLLQKDYPQLPAIQMHLHKTIPMGAGLGGGSADAAFTLQLLNNSFGLQLAQEQLISYALMLGSDCPFFIINKPCFATGRGEILQPINISLKGFHLVLINPGIHINTGWAFGQLQKIPNTANSSKNLKHFITEPILNWRYTISNDFEEPVFCAHPALKKIKENLYQQGAVYAAMSGSGSTIYGLFTSSIPVMNTPDNWMQHHISF